MEQKRGEGKQKFLKRGKMDQGVGALKRGPGTSLQAMVSTLGCLIQGGGLNIRGGSEHLSPYIISGGGGLNIRGRVGTCLNM